MIGSSTQEKNLGDHSSPNTLVTKKHFWKDPKSRSVDITLEEASKPKKCHLLTFWILKSFWSIIWYPSFFASFLVIISKRRNKRGCHMKMVFHRTGLGADFFLFRSPPPALIKIWRNRLRSSSPLTCFKSPQSIMTIPCAIIAGQDSEVQKISQIRIPYQFTKGRFPQNL